MHSRCMKKKSSSIKQESTKKHGAPQDELHELKILIKKNIQWSEVLYERQKKIQRKLTIMSLFGYLRLAVILIPLVLGIIYLPPLVTKFWDQYQSVLGVTGGVDIQGIIDKFTQE